MSNFTVIYDANVLYPSPLRSILIYLGLTDLFRVRWTMEIHEEWIRNLLKNRSDLIRENLEKRRDLMIEAIQDSVVTEYESFIDSLILPDLGDRHVLAAAIKSNSELIITNNLKDFPSNQLKKWGIEAQTPDDFIYNLFDLDMPNVLKAFKEDRGHYLRPPHNSEKYLSIMKRQGLVKTASYLEAYSELI